MNNPKNTAFFHSDYDELAARLQRIDPVSYDKTRNYLDGAVTWLSPFVTHGIISTKAIADAVLTQHSSEHCEKLRFELAWREYFHRVWQTHESRIFTDMKHSCLSSRMELPTAILKAQTGIQVIDDAIEQLVSVGNMHNHARLWTASICCNMGDTHWLPAAKWMHYHLLDGDLASNSLSWQWVAGTFSNKRYFANQDNINKFSRIGQQGSFLDVPYEHFNNMPVPDELSETQSAQFPQNLPGSELKDMEPVQGHVALRSVWQLNKHWKPEADHQWIFIDTDLHTRWPMGPQRWAFIQHWAELIPGMRIVKGSVDDLRSILAEATVTRQEYTACNHWSAHTEERVWLYANPAKPYKSFSQFWKQVK